MFYFDGFSDNHTRLLSEKFYCRWKKWVVYFQYLKNNDFNIQTDDCIPSGPEYDYLWLQGTIFVSVDEKYNVPFIEIQFKDWYESSVHLWPKKPQRENIFYCLKGLLYRLPLKLLMNVEARPVMTFILAETSFLCLVLPRKFSLILGFSSEKNMFVEHIPDLVYQFCQLFLEEKSLILIIEATYLWFWLILVLTMLRSKWVIV